jgi:hypothetical protein
MPVEERAIRSQIAKFREVARRRFWRGHDETVDDVLDNLLAPLICEVLSGRVTSIEEAATIAGERLREGYAR